MIKIGQYSEIKGNLRMEGNQKVIFRTDELLARYGRTSARTLLTWRRRKVNPFPDPVGGGCRVQAEYRADEVKKWERVMFGRETA